MEMSKEAVIYKYPMKITDRQTVELGLGDKPLSVQFQNGKLVMWAMHYPNDLPKLRNFAIYGTGHKITHECGGYIGTAQQPINGLVWHVFEVWA